MIALALRAWRGLNPTGGLIVGVLVLALIVLGTCQARQGAATDAKRAEAGQAMAEGRTAAAGDASAVRDRADDRTAQTTQTVEDATHAIRNAPDPAARDRAALVGLCRVDPSASPDCRLLLAHP